MKLIFDFFEKHKNLQPFCDLLLSKNDIQLANLKSSARSLFIAQAFMQTDKCFVLIMNDYDQAAYFYNDLQWLEDKLIIVFLPSSVSR